MADPTVSAFDAAAADYDAWFDGEGSLIFESELRAVESLASSLPRPWLEVGAGSGRFAGALRVDAGLEPSPNLVRIAAGRGVRAVLATGERQPFPDGAFGAAFLITTLCFVSWPLSVLRETRRILAPGGKVVIGMIPSTSPWGSLYRELGQQDHPIYRHASLRSYPEMLNLLERGMFAIEGIASTLLQRPGEVAEVESPRAGFTPGGGFVVIVAGKTDEA
jgi:SAM-dependent methyltransferase